MEFNFDAAMIVAIGAIVTSFLTYLSSKAANKHAAQKDEVERSRIAQKEDIQLLRDEVRRLQARVDDLTCDNENWRKKYDELYRYILTLRRILADNDICVPEMPDFDKNKEYEREINNSSSAPLLKQDTKKKNK